MHLNGRLLALDLAGRIGVAIGDPNDLDDPRFWHYDLPSTDRDVAKYLIAFRQWMTVTLQKEAPSAVVFESPVLSKKTHPMTVRKLNSLAGRCEEIVAGDFGIPCEEVNVSQMKKSFTGKGRAEKDDMVFAAKRWGWNVKVHDEADALAAWCLCVRFNAPQSHWGKRLSLGPIGAAA